MLISWEYDEDDAKSANPQIEEILSLPLEFVAKVRWEDLFHQGRCKALGEASFWQFLHKGREQVDTAVDNPIS